MPTSVSRGPSAYCAGSGGPPRRAAATASASAGPCLKPWPEPPPSSQHRRPPGQRRGDEVGVGRELVAARLGAGERRVGERGEARAEEGAGERLRRVRGRRQLGVRRERRAVEVRRGLHAEPVEVARAVDRVVEVDERGHAVRRPRRPAVEEEQLLPGRPDRDLRGEQRAEPRAAGPDDGVGLERAPVVQPDTVAVRGRLARGPRSRRGRRHAAPAPGSRAGRAGRRPRARAAGTRAPPRRSWGTAGRRRRDRAARTGSPAPSSSPRWRPRSRPRRGPSTRGRTRPSGPRRTRPRARATGSARAAPRRCRSRRAVAAADQPRLPARGRARRRPARTGRRGSPRPRRGPAATRARPRTRPLRRSPRCPSARQPTSSCSARSRRASPRSKWCVSPSTPAAKSHAPQRMPPTSTRATTSALRWWTKPLTGFRVMPGSASGAPETIGIRTVS